MGCGWPVQFVADCLHPTLESCAHSCKNVSSIFVYTRPETKLNECYCIYGASDNGSCPQRASKKYNLYKFSAMKMLAPPKVKPPSNCLLAFFIITYFIRMCRLKFVENLRMSHECSEAQIQINIEIFL